MHIEPEPLHTIWFKRNLFSEVSKHPSDTQMVTSYNPEQFSTRKEETEGTYNRIQDTTEQNRKKRKKKKRKSDSGLLSE